MSFMLLLTPVAQEMIQLVKQRGYQVLENAPVCRDKELFGYVDSPKFIICTNNIKNRVSDADYYVNETVYHETVHIAQYCKGNRLGIQNMKLSPDKLEEARLSASDKSMIEWEKEAYYLEKFPHQTIQYLKRYCF